MRTGGEVRTAAQNKASFKPLIEVIGDITIAAVTKPVSFFVNIIVGDVLLSHTYSKLPAYQRVLIAVRIVQLLRQLMLNKHILLFILVC